MKGEQAGHGGLCVIAPVMGAQEAGVERRLQHHGETAQAGIVFALNIKRRRQLEGRDAPAVHREMCHHSRASGVLTRAVAPSGEIDCTRRPSSGASPG